MSATFRSPGRRIYAMDGEGAVVRPHFDPALDLVANVRRLAGWEWGERRADWVAERAADLVATGSVGDERLCTAALLCALAVDSGRRRRPSTWSRTLTVIGDLTGLDRAVVLAVHESAGERAAAS